MPPRCLAWTNKAACLQSIQVPQGSTGSPSKAARGVRSFLRGQDAESQDMSRGLLHLADL